MFKKILGVCFAFLLASSAIGAETVGRVALVIGNAAYKSSPLANPVNDAQDMAKSLRALGFDVVERTNITSKQIGRTLRAFRTKIKPGDVALVFYAGHGLQINGENYLPAVDADIVGEEDVPNQSLSTRQIKDVLAESKTSMNLVFLDACRDNPYARSFRSATRGLSRENAPSGTLISYATRPGGVAADGTGRNGLYTSVLLKAMEETNQPIEQVLKQVVRGVTAASNGAQEPWMEGSLVGDFCFGSCSVTSNETIASIDQPDDETALWRLVSSGKELEGIRLYLARYPDGKFSEIAKSRLKEASELATEAPNREKMSPQEAPVNADSADTETAQFAKRLNLRWPANGDIVATFDDKTNKGIGIAGQLGDPIVAAADGRVVYAGSGLRGYGNLVILKHDDTFLTAYAHNQSLTVRQDQWVKKGENIARMGRSEADRVKLHFEVRLSGKPVDPIIFLPKRDAFESSEKPAKVITRPNQETVLLDANTKLQPNAHSDTPDENKSELKNLNDAPLRVIQVAEFTESGSARALRLKLERAGIKTLVNVATVNGERLIRIRVGPFSDTNELQANVNRIKEMGLSPSVLGY